MEFELEFRGPVQRFPRKLLSYYAKVVLLVALNFQKSCNILKWIDLKLQCLLAL